VFASPCSPCTKLAKLNELFAGQDLSQLYLALESDACDLSLSRLETRESGLDLRFVQLVGIDRCVERPGRVLQPLLSRIHTRLPVLIHQPDLADLVLREVEPLKKIRPFGCKLRCFFRRGAVLRRDGEGKDRRCKQRNKVFWESVSHILIRSCQALRRGP